MRASDLFGRFGGEEFAALLPETSEEAALQTCERLSQEVAGMRIRTYRGEVQITVSIGLTMLTGSDQGIDSLLKRADNALYTAKNAGRDRVAKH